MTYKTTIRTDHGPVHFEYQTFPESPTVVALDDELEYFKGQPVMDNTGKPSLRFNKRTVKDCVKIDGRIYLHRGYVNDSTLVPLIHMFLEALKDKKIWEEEKPGIKLPGIVK